MTAVNNRLTSVPVFLHRPVPGGPPAVGPVRPYTTLSPCSLISLQVLKQHLAHRPLLAVPRPEMCGAGREEPFDELSAWIFSPTLTPHSHLMRE